MTDVNLPPAALEQIEKALVEMYGELYSVDSSGNCGVCRTRYVLYVNRIAQPCPNPDCDLHRWKAALSLLAAAREQQPSAELIARKALDACAADPAFREALQDAHEENRQVPPICLRCQEPLLEGQEAEAMSIVPRLNISVSVHKGCAHREPSVGWHISGDQTVFYEVTPPKAPADVAQHFKPCPDPLTLRPDAHLPKPYGDEAPAGPVQRWNLTSRTGFPSMLETEAGPWVRYADIAPYLAPGPREETARLREALEEIMRRAEGCERLIAPSWCGGKNGYLREQWCSGCIARAALAQPGGGA